MTGRIKLNKKTVEAFVFFTFVLLFEFILVVLDPEIELFSRGLQIFKLAFNAVLALLIFPIHSFFENKLKMKILKDV